MKKDLMWREGLDTLVALGDLVKYQGVEKLDV